jgi:hypothetical protein
VENFTLGVQHTFQALNFFQASKDSRFAGASQNYYGTLVNTAGNILQVVCNHPCMHANARTHIGFKLQLVRILDACKFVFARISALLWAASLCSQEFPARSDNRPDVIFVDKLLEAAGVDLADKSRFGSSSVTTPVSQRYNGIVIIVTVRYSNADDPSTTTYRYTASVIPDAQYKIFQIREGGASSGSPGGQRVLLKRAGVKVVFQISGDMVQFNLQLLFIQAVTSLGLLSVSTLIVELIMLYLMPLRKVYKKAKYEVRVWERPPPPATYVVDKHVHPQTDRCPFILISWWALVSRVVLDV